jgi:hypothetical protein
MPDATYTYTPADADHLTFTWDGGPLIEVHIDNLDTPWAIISADEIGHAGQTERSVAGLQARADEWRSTH